MSPDEYKHWESIKKELVFAVRDAEVKKVYFILAADLACIGFSVNKTLGMNLNWNLVWLAISLCGFAYSTIAGFLFLDDLNRHRLKEADNINVHYNGGEEASDLLRELEDSNEKSTPKRNRVVYGFYFGVVLFVVWRIVEMSGFVLSL